MGKICIYARVSTLDKQDYNRQLSDCTTVILQHGYSTDDIEIFAEKISGYKKNEERPQLERMLSIIRNDPKYFDCVYITEISRLGRDPNFTRQLIDELSILKVPIYIKSIGQKTLDNLGERNTIMNIIIQVLMEFSHAEALAFSTRSKSGLLRAAKENGHAVFGAYLPYGYTKLEKKLIVDIEEVPIIKDIFRLYKVGNGCKKIASYLNEQKIPTRANKLFYNRVMMVGDKTSDEIIWSDKTINDIINNPIYKGKRRYKGQIIEAPGIIDEQLFDDCNQLMKTKTHRNSITIYDYLLKDLCTCGICGRNYFAKYKPQTSRGDKVYVCSSRLIKGGNCGNKGVNINYAESVLFEMLIDTKLLLKYIKDSDTVKKSIQKEINNLTHQLVVATGEQTKQNSKINNLLDLFENASVKKGYESSAQLLLQKFNERFELRNKELEAIETRITIIKKTIDEQNGLLTKIKELENDTDYIKKITSNRTELIVIFKQFIKKLYITKLGDKGEMLLDVHLTMTNNDEGSSLKIKIDTNATRFKSKTKYSYQITSKNFITHYDDRGILVTSPNDVLEHFSRGLPSHIMEVLEKNIMDMPRGRINEEK